MTVVWILWLNKQVKYNTVGSQDHSQMQPTGIFLGWVGLVLNLWLMSFCSTDSKMTRACWLWVFCYNSKQMNPCGRHNSLLSFVWIAGGIVGITSAARLMRIWSKKLVNVLLDCPFFFYFLWKMPIFTSFFYCSLVIVCLSEGSVVLLEKDLLRLS